MILPTRRTVVVLVALAPLGSAGLITPFALDVLVLMNALVLAAAAWDAWRAPARRSVSVVRDGPEVLSVARAGRVAYRWHNAVHRRAQLTVREVRPDLLGGAQPARTILVAPGSAETESLPVLASRRGREEGGWFAVRSTGRLGLGQRQWRFELPWSVRAYPPLPARSLKQSLAEATRRRGQRPMRRIGEGWQFESLREWVPGDDIRSIDWKATARRRKVISRQYEVERRQQVMLVLDAGRLLTAEIGGEPLFEYAVRAAQLLALAATYHDDDVGVMVFADEMLQYVPPQRGRRGLQRVLDALVSVDARLVEPDYPMAFRYLAVRSRKRVLTVLFTDAIDRLASEAMVANVRGLRPRHLPLVVTLRNPDLEAMTESRPADVGSAYRRAAAEHLIHARQEALLRMLRSGAVVVDVDPASAGPAVVRSYVDLKRKARL